METCTEILARKRLAGGSLCFRVGKMALSFCPQVRPEASVCGGHRFVRRVDGS